MGELIHWANKIDGALYESAAEPVEMRADAFKLALVIENERDQQLIERVIRDLQTRPLGEVAKSPYVTGRVAPLRAPFAFDGDHQTERRNHRPGGLFRRRRARYGRLQQIRTLLHYTPK